MGISWKEEFDDKIKIKYDGFSVENHEIDAKKLSYTLNGLTKALFEANYAVNGRYSHISLKVPSNFQEGSFEFDLITFFSSNGITALVNILTLIGLSYCSIDYLKNSPSLIKLLRITKGDKILDKKDIDGEYQSVQFENCIAPIIVKAKVIVLYENNGVAKGLIEAFKPLEDDGIDYIEFFNPETIIETIKREDLNFLKNVEQTHLIKISEYDYEFEVITPQIKGSSNNWRLTHGDKTKPFVATILDESFLDKVKMREYSFVDGTFIYAKCRKTVSKKEKIVNKYEILEVYDVRYLDTKPVKRKQTELYDFVKNKPEYLN